MNILFKLVFRNIKIFFKDKRAVFFSLLSALLMIVIFVLFLGQFTTNKVQDIVGDVEGIQWLVDSWVVAGMIIVNSITTPLSAFGIMIKDYEANRMQGFLVAPITRGKLVLGYVLSAWVISSIITTITFIVGEIYIVIHGGELLSFVSILEVLGLILISTFAGSAIVFLIVQFIKSTAGFAAISSVLGSLIGFLTAIYIQMGMLPAIMQTVTKLIPTTHAAALMRQIFVEAPMAQVFQNAPPQVVDDFNKYMGVTLYIGDNAIGSIVMLAYIIISAILFILTAVIINTKRKYW